MSVPAHIENVKVASKANVYHDGKVISRNVFLPDGSRQTLGVILPGKYNFGTEKKEKMHVSSGSATVKVAGEDAATTYTEGEFWMVPASSSFDIEVVDGMFEYCCSYLDE
jgi:purine/pyrimidine-nucleoside phosphorylase